jgi:hypothetical protein
VATSYDLFLSGDPAAGKQLIATILGENGFAVTVTPEGNYIAKRGSLALTLLIGAMAGKRFQITFTVDFFADAEGKLVARLNRNLTGSALKGGAIGANMANTRFGETYGVLSASLLAAGVLTGSVANG